MDLNCRNIVIVGVSGKAGSGKDTIGERLINKHGFYRLSFADPLKDHCRDVHGWDGKKDEYGRKLLQEEGTDKHRQLDKNVWVDHLALKIGLLFADGYNKFVITDVRFPNEADFVEHFRNGSCIRVFGRGYNLGEASSHQSETALDNYDFSYDIENIGTILELNEKIDKLVVSIICKV